MNSRIPQPNLSFVNVLNGVYHKDIWHELDMGIWRETNPLNHEYSLLNGLIKRELRRSVFPQFFPLEMDQRWNPDKQIPEEQAINCPKLQFELRDLLDVIEQYFSKFTDMHIGVQLSGGLDSSLIIGFLRYFSIPHTLVGATTSRYEFRTETFIQRKLADDSVRHILLNYEDYLPMTGIEKVPPHQDPDSLSCLYTANQAIAEICAAEGIEVLFTGEAGDLLLGSEASPDGCQWKTGGSKKTWLMDLVYSYHGIQLIPFYCDTDIVTCLWNIRAGQQADPNKLWARQYFKDFLPLELVDYTYKADFWGLYLDGLQNAIPSIRRLHDQAHEITKHPYFDKENLEDLLTQICKSKNCDVATFQRIEARSSLAVWYVKLLG